MPRMTLQNPQQIGDFLRGCGILSTGGGGDPARGLEMIEGFAQEGGKVSWTDIADVPDDAWTVSAWGMGSIAPEDSQRGAQREKLGLTTEGYRFNVDRAIRELAEYTRVKVEYLVPVELGGLNTAGPMIGALQMGIPIIDGDYTGRAAPEIDQTTPLVFGLSPMPMSSVDGWGNTCIVKHTTGLAMSERIGKHLSLASLSSVFMAGFLLRGKDVKRCLIAGTLTRSYQIGKAVREARERGEDPVAAALRAGEGFHLFQGKVVKKDWEDREGYMLGNLHIDGRGPYAGQAARIWLKNENHALWVDDQLKVTAPDLICALDASSGEPYTNTSLPEDLEVAVVGFRSAEIWRTEKGLQFNGPEHFGLELPYVPIEERCT